MTQQVSEGNPTVQKSDFVEIRWLSVYGASVALRVDNLTANEGRCPTHDELLGIVKRSTETANAVSDIEKEIEGMVLE